ncbi:ADP-ribosylation [Dentipellis sp. KUC8613]|nr:ADP-ribosylation [Dentipellis sp. KUC8613]
MQANLCDQCGKRPKFVDGTRVHNYCGKTCAAAAAAGTPAAVTNPAPANTSTATGGAADLCVACGKRPKYNDGVKTHDFCGKTCAAKGRPVVSSLMPIAASANCMVCGVRPKFREGNKTHDYCGKSCAAKAKPLNVVVTNGMCMLCKIRPVNGAHPFCSRTCGRKACKVCKCKNRYHDSKTGVTHDYCGRTCAQKDKGNRNTTSNCPGIEELPQGNRHFESVAHQFYASWRHPTPCPSVQKIYSITTKASAVSAYKDYRTRLECIGHFVSQNRSEGNEERRWHGTKRTCFLGDPGHTKMCNDSACHLCNIICTSFDMSHIGSSHGGGRFGRGLYTSSTSSKSDTPYTRNEGQATSSRYKAMLLTKVAVGKGYKSRVDMRGITSPPNGYHSVLGEVGVSLNYDELVVYRDDAIIPAYLVLYC